MHVMHAILYLHVYNLHGIMLHNYGYDTRDVMYECDIMDDSLMDDILCRRICLSFFTWDLQKVSFNGRVLELLMKMSFEPFENFGCQTRLRFLGK